MMVVFGYGRDRRRERALAGLCLVAALGGCGSVSSLETRARIFSEPVCTDFFFPVYFARGSSDLSKAAAKVITRAGGHARGCTLSNVQVVGLADYRGEGAPPPPVLAQRARNLEAALSAAGLSGVAFQRSPLGAEAPAPAPGAPEPRRADVFIRFQH